MKVQTQLFIATIFLAFGISGSTAQSGWGWGPNSNVNSTKPGDCPASDPTMTCLELPTQCKSDCECAKQEKCCPQDTCGNICKPPVAPVDEVITCDEPIKTGIKFGTCPKPLLTVRCSRCYDQCLSDCECPGQQKCCIQPGCGNWCRDTLESANIMY